MELASSTFELSEHFNIKKSATFFVPSAAPKVIGKAVAPPTPAAVANNPDGDSNPINTTAPSAALVASERKALLKVFYRSPSCRTYRVWSNEEETSLIRGVSKLGMGNWEAIRVRPEFGLSQRSALQLKDKWRNLVKYGHVAVEDFSASVAAPLPPTTPLKRKRETENIAADKAVLCTPKKAEKLQSPSPTVSDSLIAPGTPSQAESRRVARSTSGASFSTQPTTTTEASERVTRATDILLTAVDIQTDANKAVADLLDALQSAGLEGKHKPEAEAAVVSAVYVAELAREKATKARAFLEYALREASPKAPATSAILPNSFTQLMDSEDTACSTVNMQLHGATVGEPSSVANPSYFYHMNTGPSSQLRDFPDGGLDDLQTMLDNLQDDDMLNLSYNGAADF